MGDKEGANEPHPAAEPFSRTGLRHRVVVEYGFSAPPLLRLFSCTTSATSAHIKRKREKQREQEEPLGIRR